MTALTGISFLFTVNAFVKTRGRQPVSIIHAINYVIVTEKSPPDLREKPMSTCLHKQMSRGVDHDGSSYPPMVGYRSRLL